MTPKPLCRPVRSSVAAAVLTLAAVPLLANPAPATVVVQGHASPGVRGDVATVCPTVAPVLDEALQQAWHHVNQEGTLDVRFTLDGQRVSAVSATGAPVAYRRFVRAAVAGLPCQADAPVAQQFQFRVAFIAR